MADAKRANAAKEFFEKFGEKLALAIALLVLAGYAVMAFGMSGEDPNIGLVEKNRAAIEREQKAPHAEMMAPNTENWQAKAVGPWNTVVASARSADDMGGFIVTKAEGTGLDKKIIKKVPVIVPPVSFVGTEVAIDSITVAWNYKDFTNQEIQKMSREKEKVDAAKGTHFLLEREVNGSGKWEVLGDKIDTKTQTYLDTKIEPKTKYAYRVSLFSTEKNYLDRGGKVDPIEGATSNASGLVNVVTGPAALTLGIWKITYSNPMKQGDAKGMVYVKIEKFERGVGKVEKAHMQYDGDVIGVYDDPPGSEPSSKHRVQNGRKSVEVDFNTGVTLISVNPVKLVVDVKRCKPIFDKSTGNKTGCEQIIEKRNFDTALITYKDDEGIKKMHQPSPSALDQLCEEHGGKKIIVTTPQPNANPDEPKVDPKEAMKAKKEAEAEKLFEQAEAALEKNKSLAKTCYQRLMSAEYKDTDFVSKNKKPVIEERLAGLNKK